MTAQTPRITLGIMVVFLAVVIAAVTLKQLWLLAAPILLLLVVWAFEKPVVLFYVLIASIPWSVEYQFSDVLGTDFPDEPLMWFSALTALLLVVYRHKQLRQKTSGHLILILLLLQLLWATLTTITSTQPLLSVKYDLAKGWYLASFVLLPLLLLNTKERLKNTAIVLATSMMAVMILTMVRHAAAGFTFAIINDSLRPFFRNHVNYSALLVCMVPLLVVFLKSTPVRWRKWALGVLLLITLAALYFSYARGAWMALLTGALAYGLLKKRILLQGFFITAILVMASVFWLQRDNEYLHYANNYNQTIFHTNFAEHLVATYKLKDLSTAERFYRWVAGARMVGDRWKTGFGPNTFYYNYKSYTIPLFKTWVSANEEHSTVHNYFLLLLIEQGVVGLLLFLILLAVVFSTAQRLYHATTDVFWKNAIAAVAVILVMVCTVNFLSDLIETDKVGSVFYLCLVVLVIADKKIKEASDFSTHIQRIA